MRILDSGTDRALGRITIYLTIPEARELRDKVENLLTDLQGHEHIPSEDYAKEITVCVYDAGRLEHFDERSVRLIQSDM
jgi:hypothetical protein